jgi:hypothetical protein
MTTTTVVRLLSPSVNEKMISRHYSDSDDPILIGLHDTVKLTREMALKAQETANAVLANTMSTPAANHKKARDAGFALLEKATTAIDAANKAANSELAALRTRVTAPLVSKDSLTLMRQAELRERLAALPADQRKTVAQEAIKNNDDVLLGAILNAGAWELGMSDSDHAMLRHSWASKNYAPELSRIDRVTKAVADAQRAGTVALDFVNGLTDAELIESATSSEKKANAALQAVKG